MCAECVGAAETPRCWRCNAAGHPIPWEDTTRGRVKAFGATVRALIAPDRFFANAPWTGGLKGPLYFAVCASFFGAFGKTGFALVSYLALGKVGRPLLDWFVRELSTAGALRGEQRRLVESLPGHIDMLNAMMLQIQLSELSLNPLQTILELFVLAALTYPIARHYGGQGTFEGTFRVIAYAKGAQVASAIPGMGGALAFLWGVVLVVVGMRRAHGLPGGKAFIVAVWWFPFAAIAFLLMMAWMISVAGDLMLGR